MPTKAATALFVCRHCLQASRLLNTLRYPSKAHQRLLVKRFATQNGPSSEETVSASSDGQAKGRGDEEKGAMSRRLSDMTEVSLEEGGRRARKAVEEAGFDTELKEKLLARIKDAQFRSENAGAFSQINMPSSAGRGTQEQALASPWSGSESVEDAALRMLADAHKPIRVPFKIPTPRGITQPPKKVDTGRARKGGSSAGVRLASAREKSSVYSYLKDDGLSDTERGQMRKELKERFMPGARSVPATLQGLASLANERIEDAISRGQFKNLPRGQKIERDYNMSSPFIDTTEYFMNKIIQKQDIVPPWIEKQQELIATATKFRSRVRNDWRRHAARLIASTGGSLEEQVRRAEQHAAAEAIDNPPTTKEVRVNAIDRTGHLSEIRITQPPLPNSPSSEEKISPDLQTMETNTAGSSPAKETYIRVTETDPSADVNLGATVTETTAPALAPDTPAEPSKLSVGVFRSQEWEDTERSYHVAAIENLNSLTRSYNLIAPTLAKKPYYKYERELRNMYADVAPQIADAIRERAVTPQVRIDVVGKSGSGGVLEQFTTSSARVYDERKPRYGLREFWRDLFSRPDDIRKA